jgi:predicted RNA-binding Zn-ribbon protein involved in translation (DUF1610 family)
MIKEFRKSIGYICPYCSTITIRDVNLFDFSGSAGTDFLCSNGMCAHQNIRVSSKKDRYAISVDCPICGETHLYNIRKMAFWNNDFFVLRCSESGFGVLFIGAQEQIKSEIADQEKLINELEEDFTVSEELSVIFEAVEHINELAKNESISCSCGSRNIAIEIDNDFITLFCRDCGLVRKLRTDKASLEELLKMSTIVL